MRYYIITGTSRGLGEAIAKKLLDQGSHIFCISRRRNERLIQQASELQAVIDDIPFDLSHGHEIETLLSSLFRKIDKKSAESIILINNAGIVAPIKPIELCTADEMIKNTQVNLTAPMILSAQFTALTSDMNIDKQIINISSGAGKKPYSGWSNYCSTKAGLDMLTKCMAVEQASKEFPVRIVSVSPGVMDTEMQQEIRETRKEHFSQLDRFLALKEEGMLMTPEDVAAYILEVMANKDIKNGAMLDIRDKSIN